MKNRVSNGMLLLAITVLCLVLATGCEKEDNGKVTDIDGNVYSTVTIGTQVWLVENLKVTRYRNGDEIPEITDNTEWSGLTTGAYCNYNNMPANSNDFGRLYNWYAIKDNRNLAPEGWHVPSVAEWEILENYLIDHGYNYDGTTSGNKIAKSLASATGWQPSDVTGAPGNPDYPAFANKSGFTAIPAGYRNDLGEFLRRGFSGDTWSSSGFDADLAWEWDIDNDYNSTSRDTYYKKAGFVVRCIKD